MTQSVKIPKDLDSSLVRMVDIALHTDGRQKNPSVKAILKHAKVLKCLYDVAEVLYDYERPFSEIMQQVAALISEGFQYPQKAAVRIECCGFTYLTPHFKTSPWMISNEIDCHDTVMGRIDVSYIEPLANGKDRSFIPAEKTLLAEISKRISKNCFIRHEADILRIGASHLNMTFETAKIGLFHLDATGRFLKINPFFVNMLGYSVNQLLTLRLQDVLVGLNKDAGIPAISAFHDGQIREFRERVKLLCADGSVYSGEIALSLDQADDRQFDCLIGSIQKLESEEEVTKREAELEIQVQRAGHEIVHVLSKALAHRDPYTYDHQNRVATLAVSIGRQMGIRGEQLQHLEMGARIHDIGKLDIPAEILSKPGKLTSQEFDLVKTHSVSGHDIVDSSMLPPIVRDIILHHHERWNGTGYPDGLKGTEISLESRIVAVADTLESITTHRPYRPGRGLNIALGIIKEEKGVLFDSEVADMCVSMGEEGYFDWLIHPHA